MSQPQFNNAYMRLMNTFNQLNPEKYDECIKYFFDIGKSYGQPDFDDYLLLNKNNDDKKLFLKDLVTEVINMDMCIYVSTGVNPLLGSKFYNKMRSCL